MEVRGLGIYPVEKLFPGQTATRCPIDLVVDLRPFDAARDVGRIKPVSETATLSGLSVPCVRLPVISCADAALMIELLVKDILLRGDRDL
jgi:serine kinase of HPr protein (carbohydrate metabolism regulator)